MPPIRLPDPPIPYEEQRLALERVARRWRVPVTHVRIRLLQAGVPLVSVPRAPAEGVRVADLEAYEQKLRNGEED
jgi:hypothetical protein